MVNQSVQLINAASLVHPYFGKTLLVFFVILGIGALLSVAMIITKLEKPLEIPSDENSEEYNQYILKLKNRLMKNSFLRKSNYIWDNEKADIESVNNALSKIDEEAVRIIKASAGGIFTTTAISQNGSLDGIFVFVTSIKLVWNISNLYSQRPSIKNLIKLYINVFGTVLAAKQIDDLDILSEELGQVLSTVMTGSLGKMVPIASFITSFVVDSILEGTINTLLVLRIGLLTQYYCRSITRAEPKRLMKTATVQAGKMLGEIISKDLISIIKVWTKASGKALVDLPKNTAENIWELIRSKIKNPFEEAAVTDKE